MPEIRLGGCNPEPLMHYLKALGVLRTLTDDEGNGDPHVAGAWRGGEFCLETKLDGDGLVGFFLDFYRPTPIIAPWAGGSGFFGSDNREAADAIVKSNALRLAGFADLIVNVRQTPRSARHKAKALTRG